MQHYQANHEEIQETTSFSIPRQCLSVCLALIFLGGINSPLPAAEHATLATRIDARLKIVWQKNDLQAAELTTDEEFVRRVTLDLTGKIPRVAEIYQFLENESEGRRSELIENLLSRPRHAVHLANLWRTYLLSDNLDNLNPEQVGGFEEWLRSRFRDNVPYNQLVKELLLAEGSFNQVGPALYYSSLQVKPEELARSTSRTFLGVQLDCAQCHDHPFDDWKQADFWGYAAFFAQLSPQQNNANRMRARMSLSDRNVGEVSMPDSEESVAPKFFGETEAANLDKKTRRTVLAEWMTAGENQYFARATVNRIWTHLFGLGIVNPPDNFSSLNPPIDEELLDMIATDFIAHNYNLRYLLRELTNTRAYQLSSRGKVDEGPEESAKVRKYFARHALKPFTADQLFDGLALATSRPVQASAAGIQNINQARLQFVNKFRRSGNDQIEFQVGIPQALTLMNGTLISQAVNLEQSRLLKSLEAPFYSDEQKVETLFLATVSHFPSEKVRLEFTNYVKEQPNMEAKREALSHILWALLNSAEFSMNN